MGEILAYTKQSIEEKREKAGERSIVGQYGDLAVAVRRLMGWEVASDRPFLTARDASYRTGVNYSTIAAMARGERASADTIRRFSGGFEVDPLPLLQAAEYLDPDPEPSERDIAAGESLVRLIREYDEAHAEFERLYAENPTMGGRWGEASQREKKALAVLLELNRKIAISCTRAVREGSADD